MNQDPGQLQAPAVPPAARILIGACRLAIAVAVVSGATLAARPAHPPERRTDGPDFDPVLASAICASERAAPAR